MKFLLTLAARVAIKSGSTLLPGLLALPVFQHASLETSSEKPSQVSIVLIFGQRPLRLLGRKLGERIPMIPMTWDTRIIPRSETMPPENGRISQRLSVIFRRIVPGHSPGSSLRDRILHSPSEPKTSPSAQLRCYASRVCRGRLRKQYGKASVALQLEFVAHFAGA